MRISETLLFGLVMGIALLLLLQDGTVHAQTTCQTTESSPSVSDCMAGVAYLTNKGSRTECVQTDCQINSTGCTGMVEAGSCILSICGVCGGGVTCDIAADNLAINVISNCQSNGRVAGFFIDDYNGHLKFTVSYNI